MNIIFNEQKQLFHLSNEHISYAFTLEEGKYLSHHYWGKKVNNIHSGGDYPKKDRSFLPNPEHVGDRNFSLSALPQEYPGTDVGDYRESAYTYRDKDNWRANQLLYKGYTIEDGKEELQGLPHTYITENSQAKTLKVKLEDSWTGMQATLHYTIFSDLPVVTRSVCFHNASDTNLVLDKALSMSLDFSDADFDLIQLPGAWARERDVVRSPIVRGVHKLDSKRGTTSHSYQPFLALARKETTEQMGEVYGVHFVYSGEFLGNVEVDEYSHTRIQMGINPEHFEWTLKPGKEFQTPETVMVYSENGLNGMSQALHQLYQYHLIRGTHQYKERPVLINNWEGTYFDFTEEKLNTLVDAASTLGIELFVLDDGWFGKRDSDYTSLGDWVVYEEKLPSGLKTLSEKVHQKGMKFGLWFEPEMVSEDSELYRQHPDWCIHTPGRAKSRGRSQLVLDFSRKEVRDNILWQIKTILDDVPIDYIKWDYNRNMTEIGTGAVEALPGEVAHKYMLGLYEVLEDLVTSYPDILFESCSGGGGRYDPGMLYYMPQTWTSDNTDAIARLEIQTGTSLIMPISSMGAHVSAAPNHQVNRHTTLKMRGDVAMSGNLGYELDATKLSEEEKLEVKQQIDWYKEFRSLIQFGTFYRLLSPFESKQETAWMFVDEEQDQAVYFYFQIMDRASKPSKRVKMTGLNPKKTYKLDDGRLFGGDELMYRGIYLDPELYGDYQSRRIVLEATKQDR